MTTNPVIADRTARNCLILPGPEADLKIPGELAETAVTLGSANKKALHLFQFGKALAEYRQGHWDGAVLWAQRAVENPFPYTRAGSYAVLAMAQHRLGHSGNSRDTLEKCVEVVEKQLPKLEAGDLGSDWRDLIIAHALLAEARSTIQGPTPANGKPEAK